MSRIQIDHPALFEDIESAPGFPANRSGNAGLSLKPVRQKNSAPVPGEPGRLQPAADRPARSAAGFVRFALLIIVAFAAGYAGGRLAVSRAPQAVPPQTILVPAAGPEQPAPETAGENRVIETGKIHLVDHEGNVRGVIGIEEDGQQVFSLNDAKGYPLLTLEPSHGGGSVLKVHGPDQKSYAALGSLDAGETGLVLADKQGLTRARLTLAGNKYPSIGFLDDGGNARLSLSLAGNEDPLLKMHQGNTDSGLQLGIASDGTKGLFYFAGYGFPSVGLVQPQGKDPVFGFLDRQNQLIWGVPAPNEPGLLRQASDSSVRSAPVPDDPGLLRQASDSSGPFMPADETGRMAANT